MKSALIGHTGFVGSTLLRQGTFDALFNSANIESIQNQRFDRVVCAGARAEKWKANQDPATDRAGLDRLIQSLETVRAKEFILISTIDVYPDPRNVDEDSQVDWGKGSAYGYHRRLLEQFAMEYFQAYVVRLPGLFGTGLKKNAVYDLIHNNQVDKINPESQFQFYSLTHLTADLQKMTTHGIRVLNVATEPTTMQEVAETAFGKDLAKLQGATPARYDMHSKHAKLWGGEGYYLYSKPSILKDMKAFVESECSKT